MTAIELLTIRHAPVDAEGICYGQFDVPTLIEPEGVVARISDSVASFKPITIWSSDASRCLAPARLLADSLGVTHRVDTRVRELSYGEWEGREWNALPQSQVDEWMVDWLTRSPPGGETVSDLAGRVSSWWADLAHGAHFLMAHAGVVHCLDVVAGGMSWEETMEVRLDYLSAKRFPEAVRRPA